MSKKFTHTIFKKAGILILAAFIFHGASAQRILILSDTFSMTIPSIIFNAAGVGGNYGNNNWVINAQYNGQPTYPNTPNEDSVLGGLGQISGAPYSTYLHIHDVAQPGGIANANWNPASGSDRFCYMGRTFCTLGFTDVIFTFFWTGQGDSTAYGRVYYTTNGGATWTQTGQPKYYNQPYWKYESIQDTNFNNKQNLQFGFRWVNAGADTTKDVSWGIDDIIAIGSYNSITNPANLNIISVTPDTVCQNGSSTILFSLNPPLCDGSYEAIMSDSVGNFSNPIVLQHPFNLDASSIYWQVPVDIPNGVEGNCFRIIIKRIGPPPLIQSDTSACFTIQHCPVSIVTNSAPVLSDADTACLKSAIDIYFNSFGNFNNGNIYYAQLSDSNGSFAHPDTIGRLPSIQAYPSMPPGDVSGLIPTNVPPGCGYYVRVVSSNPPSVGNVIGPFCLTKCDVTTNNTQDLQVCINYPYPTDTLKFKINTNQWNQGASYDTCNNWTVELLDMTTLNVLSVGGLGIYHDSIGGTFTMIIGPQGQLPVPPGTYYMRIISNCSNEPWNENGTIIRITIGAPSSTPPVSILSTNGDSVYCNTTAMELYVNPYNSQSTYSWNSNFFNPITAPAILVNLSGSLVGEWVAYVREENFGCFGPLSAPYNFVTTTTPIVHLSGPKKVCQGDTAVFSAGYYPATYYDWTAPPGVKVGIQSNSQVSLIFDSLGTYTINEYSVNDCGSDNGSLTITVFSLFTVNAKPDKLVCLGDSVSLTGAVDPYPRSLISLDSSVTGNQGGMFNIYAHDDIIIDSFAVSYRVRAANTTVIYSKHGTYRNFEQTPSSWSLLATSNITLPNRVLSKTVIPVELNKRIAAGDTFAFYISTTNTAPTINMAYGNGIGIQQGVVYKTDHFIDFEQGCVNAYPFGAHLGPKVLDVTVYYRTKAGLRYIWNNGDTTSTISFVPTQSGEYHVKVFDSTGCTNADSVFVKVDTLPRVFAGPDTIICPYINYIMPAIASPTATLNWAPATGLNQPDSLNPVFNYNQSSSFILTVTNPDGCKKIDTVLININPLSVNAGPDTTICIGEEYIMLGSASTDSIEWFPTTGLSAVNILNPVLNYNATNQYFLQVKDTNGCKLTDSVIITIEYCNSYIKVPQAFTPNNDGTNDYFTVFGKYISDYQIRIYNRWGEEVYSSNNINELNDLSRGWDGTYKGKLQDVGTFVYYITAKDLNGQSIFKKGNVTLIR